MGNKGRLSTRIGIDEINRTEIYMHLLSRFTKKLNEDSYRVEINKVSHSFPFPMEKKRKIMHEIARLEMFIDTFDSITRGRGKVYIFNNYKIGTITRYGSINVAHEVTGISRDTIFHGAKIEGRIIHEKYKVESFTYEELTNGNLINSTYE